MKPVNRWSRPDIRQTVWLKDVTRPARAGFDPATFLTTVHRAGIKLWSRTERGLLAFNDWYLYPDSLSYDELHLPFLTGSKAMTYIHLCMMTDHYMLSRNMIQLVFVIITHLKHWVLNPRHDNKRGIVHFYLAMHALSNVAFSKLPVFQNEGCPTGLECQLAKTLKAAKTPRCLPGLSLTGSCSHAPFTSVRRTVLDC